MIDVKVLRQDPDRIRASQRARGESEAIVDELVATDETRRSAIARYEEARAEQKELGKRIPRAQGEERTELLARTKELAELVKQAEAAQNEAGAAYEGLLKQVGNLVADGVPEGGEDDYVVLETIGSPRDFAAEGFTPRDHLELG
ncbi:MAG: serS, partial [Friedmanniella sp.]|nr:serS [Friedmanniella sp.]